MGRPLFARGGGPDARERVDVRPDALPTAPTEIANAATCALKPDSRAKGTSWLITIVPAVVPSAYAIHNW